MHPTSVPWRRLSFPLSPLGALSRLRHLACFLEQASPLDMATVLCYGPHYIVGILQRRFILYHDFILAHGAM